MASLHSGHRQRLRERFIKNEFDNFNEHEILELLLCYVIPVRNVNPLAHSLIERFGSVKGVLSASEDELLSVKGVGSATAEFIVHVNDICKNLYDLRNEYYSHSIFNMDIKGLFFDQLKNTPLDTVCIMYLDGYNYIAKIETISHIPIHKSDELCHHIVNSSLDCSANSIILGHSHGKGMLEMSGRDKVAVASVRSKAKLFNIRMIDNFVVNEEGIKSCIKD